MNATVNAGKDYKTSPFPASNYSSEIERRTNVTYLTCSWTIQPKHGQIRPGLELEWARLYEQLDEMEDHHDIDPFTNSEKATEMLSPNKVIKMRLSFPWYHRMMMSCWKNTPRFSYFCLIRSSSFPSVSSNATKSWVVAGFDWQWASHVLCSLLNESSVWSTWLRDGLRK